MKIPVGALLYLEAQYENDDHFMKEFARYANQVPEGVTLDDKVSAFQDASEDYGVLDLYVIRCGDRRYGRLMYRAVGKHANYYEIHEDFSAEDGDLVEFSPVRVALTFTYAFEEDG